MYEEHVSTKTVDAQFLFLTMHFNLVTDPPQVRYYKILSKSKFLLTLYYMGVKSVKKDLGTGRDGQFAPIVIKF